MKNKSGFTIVELLAIIVILGITIILVMPNIIGISDNEKQKKYDAILNSIYSATESYITTYYNNPTYPITIKLSTLISENYIKAPLENPITGEEFDYNMYVMAKKNTDNTISYIYPYQTENAPDLLTGLVPVYYDSVNMVWRKAPTANTNNIWYDYSHQQWANAVTIISASQIKVANLASGSVIETSDINTFWVWIPRYEYKITGTYGLNGTSTTNPGQIEVKFISKTQTTPSNGYIIHPAFTFGTTEENGIWIGKFETTGTSTSPTILPNAISLGSLTVKTMYDSVKTYMQGSSTYGFSSDSDVRMSKAADWRAALYLSQSIYGKYGNPSYSGTSREIYLNNSNSLYTGRSMGAQSGSGVLTPTYDYALSGYYTYDGKCAMIYAGLAAPCTSGSVGQILTNRNYAYGASSTGNIYGLYDMSGGTYEYVMSFYKPSVLSGIVDNSGFSSATTNSQYDLLTINSKYYNTYSTSNALTACNGGICYGYGLSETSAWYSDRNLLPITTAPWQIFGGVSTEGADVGAFSYTYTSGIANATFTFRITLSKP